MTPQDRIEFKELIRETLAEFLSPAGQPLPLPSFVADYLRVEPVDTCNPFLMNDTELRFAERLLPEDERPILRMRVMAARLESRGQRNEAGKMQRRADNKERQLLKKAA